MPENKLPPMAPGGEWLSNGSHHGPTYVTHEAHIKRLLSEGWRPADDPRKPVEAKPAVPSKEDQLMAQLAAALARIDALEAARSEPDPAPDDGVAPSYADLDAGDSANDEPAKPARKPRR